MFSLLTNITIIIFIFGIFIWSCLRYLRILCRDLNPNRSLKDYKEMKIAEISLPFILELPEIETASEEGIELVVCSKEAYKCLIFWGVSINQLHTVLWQPWSDISSAVDQGTLLRGFYQYKGAQMRYPPQWQKKITLPFPPAPLVYGPLPRLIYPLVIIQIRDFVVNPTPKENMALFSVIHVADEHKTNTAILVQYYKQANGEVTCLEKLYICSSGTTLDNMKKLTENEVSDLLRNNTGKFVPKSEFNESTKENSSTLPIVVSTKDSEATLAGSELSELPYDGPFGQIIITEDGKWIRGVTSRICVVCQSAPLSYAFLPCKHACVCEMCLAQLNSCPLCRCPIEFYFRFCDTSRSSEHLVKKKKVWSFFQRKH